MAAAATSARSRPRRSPRASRHRPAREIKSRDVDAMGYPTTESIACAGDLPSQWTNARRTVKIFRSMQLGGETEALEQIQLRALERARVSTRKAPRTRSQRAVLRQAVASAPAAARRERIQVGT